MDTAVACADDDLVLTVLVKVEHQNGRRRGVQPILPLLHVLAVANAQAEQLQRGEAAQQQLVVAVFVDVDQPRHVWQVGIIQIGQRLTVVAQQDNVGHLAGIGRRLQDGRQRRLGGQGAVAGR